MITQCRLQSTAVGTGKPWSPKAWRYKQSRINQTKRKMKRAHSSDILKINRMRKKRTFIKANSFKAASHERYSQLKLLRCLR